MVWGGGERVLTIKAPTELGYLDGMSHCPLSKTALDQSVTKLLEITENLPDYEEGYEEWLDAFNTGQGGIFTGPLNEVIETIEQGMNS